MSEYITLTYFDTDKKQVITVKCDAASLCEAEPSHRGKKAADKHVVQVKTKVFELTDIPNALVEHGKRLKLKPMVINGKQIVWGEFAKKIQKKWFSVENKGKKKMPEKTKKAEFIKFESKDKWPANQIMSDCYPFDWAVQSNLTGDVKKAVDTLLNPNRTAQRNIYNQAANNKIKEIFKDEDKDQRLKALTKCYGDTKSLLTLADPQDNQKFTMEAFHIFFSFQTASVFNSASEKVSLMDKVLRDEFFATTAGCTITAAIGKYQLLKNKLIVKSVYLYSRDTFDFNNDGGFFGFKDQYLGHWNHTGFEVFYGHQFLDRKKIVDTNQELNETMAMTHPEVMAMPSTQFKSTPEERWFPVRNSTYNEWRNKHGKGGDLMVFSELKEVPCVLPIVVDF